MMLCSKLSLSCITIAILSFLAVSPASAFGLTVSCRRQYTKGDGLHRSITNQLPRNSATIGRSSNLFSTSSEFGEVTASSSAARLNPTLIEAAHTLLPWETENNNGSNDDDATTEEIGTGQQWYETRQILTKLWVLPRDMSNGSWENYAKAANDGEDRMLSSVPQLLRLAPEDIETSAKTVMQVLQLPPALLRREPLLLTVRPDRLVRGFDCLLLAEAGDERLEGADAKVYEAAVREACKDTPGLLLEAATKE